MNLEKVEVNVVVFEVVFEVVTDGESLCNCWVFVPLLREGKQ